MQIVGKRASTATETKRPMVVIENKQPLNLPAVRLEEKAAPSAIFTNERVWSEDYIPDVIPFREDQIEKLNFYLTPILRKSPAANVLLLGQFGTGKTAVTRHVINKFVNKAEVNGATVAIYWSNASKYTTAHQQVTCNRLMQTWLTELGEEVYATMPMNIVTDMMERKTKEFDSNIFIIDEVDEYLCQTNNDFNRFAYVISRCFHNSSTILITNKYWVVDYLQEKLDARTADTFTSTLREIGFTDYNDVELLQILKNRAAIGLKPTSYTPELLKFVADISWRQGWKARGVIQLINWAGTFAERQGYERLEPWMIEHVAKRKPERDLENMIANFDPPMFYILRMLIAQHDTGMDWVKETDAIEWFSTKEKSLKLLSGTSKRTFLNALSKLKGLDIVRSELIGRGRGMGTYVRLQIQHDYRQNVRNVMDEFKETVPEPNTATEKIEKRWQSQYIDTAKENGDKATGA